MPRGGGFKWDVAGPAIPNNGHCFIAGDLINLENTKNKNKKGLELHKMLSKLTMKNDKPNEERIVNLLMELPLYMLFAFLGYTSYEKHINKTIKENEEEIRKNMKEGAAN